MNADYIKRHCGNESVCSVCFVMMDSTVIYK